MPDMEVNDPIKEIERLLSAVEKAHPDQKPVLAAIREQLRSVTTRNRPSPRRTGEATTYSVEGTGGHAGLAEYRSSGPPLRVPKPAYDHVVNVLAAADRPLPFDDLMSALRKGADPPADWQVRVVLRYLLRADPAVLRRTRSRYQPITLRAFKAGAERWWKATTRGTKPR